MAADADDKFLLVGNPGTATTLSAPGYTQGNATINVASTTNFPTLTGVVFAIDVAEVVDGEEVRVDGSYCVFAGTVTSATAIGNLTLLSGTAQDYAAGALTRVYITVSALHNKRLIEGLLAEHTNPSGYHALTSNATITSSTITTPKIITSLNDTNDNELFKVTPTASAVNEFTVANAATGNAPVLSATGGDANVGITISPKGTGALTLNGIYNPYKFSVHKSAAQTGIADNTATKVLFDTEKFDTNNNFASSTYTVPVTGFYQINAYLSITSSANNAFVGYALLYKNGAMIQQGGGLYPNATGATLISFGNINHLVQLSAGDTLEIYVNMDVNTGTVTVNGGANVSSFSGYLVSIT